MNHRHRHRRSTVPIALCLLALSAPHFARAADDADPKAEMQRALNREVMSSPFNAGDIKKAQAYAEEAKRQNIVPVAEPPSYWMPGWTCASMTAYPGYVYGDYRGCVYYHYYYGRYWRR